MTGADFPKVPEECFKFLKWALAVSEKLSGAEAMTEARGCEYKEHPLDPPCRKVCDAGESLCPHHLLLTRHAKTKTEAKTPRGYQE